MKESDTAKTIAVRRTYLRPVERRSANTKPAFDDNAIREHIANLKECRSALEDINELTKEALEMPGQKRSRVKRVMTWLTPVSIQKRLPKKLALHFLEEYDALEMIEQLLRKNLNNTQDALKELAACAIQKQGEIEELAQSLDKAEREGWDAKELQKFMADRAGIEVFDVVARLLDKEFEALSDDDREKRKTELLEQLRNNVAMGKTLVTTLGTVCVAGLQVFGAAIAQYVDYTQVYRSVAVIRDAAKTLVETNHANLVGPEALSATFEASIRAIEQAVESAEKVKQYSVAGPDMQELFKSGEQRLAGKFAQLGNEAPMPKALPSS